MSMRRREVVSVSYRLKLVGHIKERLECQNAGEEEQGQPRSKTDQCQIWATLKTFFLFLKRKTRLSRKHAHAFRTVGPYVIRPQNVT